MNSLILTGAIASVGASIGLATGVWLAVNRSSDALAGDHDDGAGSRRLAAAAGTGHR